jgi:hypothetical protein
MMYIKNKIVPPDQQNHLLASSLHHKSFCPEGGAQPPIPLTRKEMLGAIYGMVGLLVAPYQFKNSFMLSLYVW